jgi:hypothetical protein
MADTLVSTDNQAFISPYKLGQYVWEIIAPYFEKYDIAISEAYPLDVVEKPTIVWRTRRRTAGTAGVRSKGKSYAYKKGVTADGIIEEVHQANFDTLLEFSVFGTSPSTVDDIVWDLENAINESVGTLQRAIPGFAMVFHEQWADHGLSVRVHNEVIYRTILFRAYLPVSYLRSFRQIRGIEIVFTAGRLTYVGQRQTRSSSSTEFEIPVSKYRIVTNIIDVSIVRNTEHIVLEKGVDYTVSEPSINQSSKITWLDDTGLTPAVNENFQVTYSVSTVFLADVYKKYIEE